MVVRMRYPLINPTVDVDFKKNDVSKRLIPWNVYQASVEFRQADEFLATPQSHHSPPHQKNISSMLSSQRLSELKESKAFELQLD